MKERYFRVMVGRMSLSSQAGEFFIFLRSVFLPLYNCKLHNGLCFPAMDQLEPKKGFQLSKEDKRGAEGREPGTAASAPLKQGFVKAQTVFHEGHMAAELSLDLKAVLQN